MKNQLKQSEKGITVIEVLIIVVVLGIVATFAIFQLGNSRTQFDRENLAREFKVYLERCRFDSVRRRADFTNPDNLSRVKVFSNSYEVYYDMNQDGKLSTDEKRVVNFDPSSNVKIAEGSDSNPVTVYFNNRGHTTITENKNFVDPVFTFCTKNCSEGFTNQNSTTVVVSPTGTIAMLLNRPQNLYAANTNTYTSGLAVPSNLSTDLTPYGNLSILATSFKTPYDAGSYLANQGGSGSNSNSGGSTGNSNSNTNTPEKCSAGKPISSGCDCSGKGTSIDFDKKLNTYVCKITGSGKN